MDNYDPIIIRAAQQHGVDPEIIRKVIEAESAWNPRATSPRGAQGLMQLMPDTARGLGVKDSFDPEQNIMGGTQYLSQMMKQFGGDKRKALAAYNFGPTNVAAGKPYPTETTSYLDKVLGPEKTAVSPRPVVQPSTMDVAPPVMVASNRPRRPYPQPAPPPPDLPQDPALAYNWKNALGGMVDKARGAWDSLIGPAEAKADPTPLLSVPPPRPQTTPQVNSVSPRVVANPQEGAWRRALGQPPVGEDPNSVLDTENRGPLGMSSFRPDVRGLGDTYVASPPDSPVRSSPPTVARPRNRWDEYMRETPNPQDYKQGFWSKLATGLVGGAFAASGNPEMGLGFVRDRQMGAYNRALQTHRQKGEDLERIMLDEERAARAGREERRLGLDEKRLGIEEREQTSREKYWGALGSAATEKAEKYGTYATRPRKPIPMKQQSEAWQTAAANLYATNPKVRKYIRKIESPGRMTSFELANENQESYLFNSFSEDELNELQNVQAMIDKEAQKYTGRMVDPYEREGFGTEQ